jgi:hypothetical protein
VLWPVRPVEVEWSPQAGVGSETESMFLLGN